MAERAVRATAGLNVRAAEPTEVHGDPSLSPRTATRKHAPFVAGVAIVVLALAMRLVNRSSNYDIFVDEITYSSLGRAVAGGHGVTLYGSPFFLHPPAFFYLEGALLHLFGTAKSTLTLVLDLRFINCVIGAIDCGLVMLLVTKLTNRWAALGAGLFVALDPFILHWDGRVVLETLAMTTAIAGWLCLVALADLGTTRQGGAELTARREWAFIIGAGVMFGISLVTKETYAFVGVVPLGVLLAQGAPVRRGRCGPILVVAALFYYVYWLTVVADGRLKSWWAQQSTGLERAAGTKQISGFNQAGHATFASRLGADLHLYLVSYLAVAAVGVAAGLWILRWLLAARSGREPAPKRRLAIVLAACAVAYVGYAALRGAFEEQIFYMCLVAGIPLLAVSAEAAWSRYGCGHRRYVLVVSALFGIAVLGFELAVDARVRTTRDSDLRALVTYVRRHVPYFSLVDSTDGVSQFLLEDVRIDVTTTLAGVRRDRPGYVVVAPDLDQQGYVRLAPGFARWLARDGHVVFRTRDRSIGQLLLYRTVEPPSRHLQ